MRGVVRSEMTGREYEQHQWDVEERERTIAFQLQLKQMDIELAKVEARWSTWLRLPVLLIKLPVMLVLAFGYCVGIVIKKEPPEQFWKFMR